MTGDRLSPSDWTVPEARMLVAKVRHVAGTGPEYDAVELFGALCDYLDELTGGFDRLLSASRRTEVARLVDRLHAAAPAGSALVDDDGVPVDLADPENDPVYDGVWRPDQPVNSALTVPQGRRLAATLAATDGWRAEVGKALLGVYGYLDDLYGGPGAFAVLLTPQERTRVARLITTGRA